LPLTLQDCEAAYKQKRKELIKAEKEEIKDGKLRKEHQEELIASHLDEGNKEHPQLLWQMKRAEAVSKVFTKLRAVRGLNKEGGLSYITAAFQLTQNAPTMTTVKNGAMKRTKTR